MANERLMILGGLLGFLIGIACGSAQQSAWPTVIWRASTAALAGGLLLRWWGRIWTDGLQQAWREREQSPEPEPAAANAKTKS